MASDRQKLWDEVYANLEKSPAVESACSFVEPEDGATDIFEGGDSLPYWLFRGMAARAEVAQCERGLEDSCGSSGDCITEYCVPCAAKVWMGETRRREAMTQIN